MLELEAALQKHSLTLSRRIYEGSKATVYLVLDASNKKYGLKFYTAKCASLQREMAFYRLASATDFRHLYIPGLLATGDNYVVSEYVERELLTRDTILARDWSEQDLDRWVEGVVEFQGLRLDRRLFSYKKQVLGVAYPATRMAALLGRMRKELSWRDAARIGRWAAAYVGARFFFHNVTTHYDFQTTNYTFTLDRSAMSLLDFEFSYYSGDPLFDVLYYCTIPVVGIEAWTFQTGLVRRYVQVMRQRKEYAAFWEFRLRLILLLCNVIRFLYFRGNQEKQTPYRENIQLLLDDAWFHAFVREQVLASPCVPAPCD